MKRLVELFWQLSPGIVLGGLVAWASIEMAQIEWFQSHGIGALTLAIVSGILLGNTLYPSVERYAGAGVVFSKGSLLRLGIIFYGLRLTFQDIGNVGWAGVLIDALVVCSTFSLAYYVGTRFFDLDPKTAILIGAGSSICGAAAVMASEPVVRGRAEQVTVAVATVVVMGTIAMFAYPAFYHMNSLHHWIAMSPSAYGIFAGSTMHEVAQVVVAGRAIGEDAANTAVIVKMVRVMMLAPFLIVLSAWLSQTPDTKTHAEHRPSIVIPWFALGFVAVTGINSLSLLAQEWAQLFIHIDTVLLAMAMAGLGLTTHISTIRKAGLKPIALAAFLFVWLIFGGWLINLSIMKIM